MLVLAYVLPEKGMNLFGTKERSTGILENSTEKLNRFLFRLQTSKTARYVDMQHT
jgi:hypothetical protein